MILHPKMNLHLEKPPKNICKKYSMECNIIFGQNCYSFKKTEIPDKHIMYFHGGAYVLQAQKMHWRIIENILEKTNYEITLINYPLVPEYTCCDTIAMALEVYSFLRKKKIEKPSLWVIRPGAAWLWL